MGTPNECVYYVAVSLDGFIAGENDDISWLDPYPATDVGYDEFIAGVGGLVMGRRTYEIVRRMGDWPYGRRPTAVATRRALADAPEGVFAMDGTPAELLSALRDHRAKGRIWLEGGGDLSGQFLEAGLIDALELGIIPVLLGKGVALFGGVPLRHLELQWAKGLKHGIIHARYTLPSLDTKTRKQEICDTHEDCR
jgi:dihydrofolate reductase